MIYKYFKDFKFPISLGIESLKPVKDKSLNMYKYEKNVRFIYYL